MASSNLLRTQDFGQRPRRRRDSSPARCSHNVQFYESEEYLVGSVSDYLADGLRAKERLLVIATESHRADLVLALSARKFDVAGARDRGQLLLLDARETLSTFMSGDEPDAARFRQTIGPLVERTGRRGQRARVRAYGEMVDLLARDGNSAASILLESLWNDLSSAFEFELLCGYAMSSFADASDAENFHDICRQHVHVVPTERYTRADDAGRLLEISLLQQRAQALEREVARRERLEQRLREALDEKERSLHAERAARTEAESANRAKNQFLAVMSHELRTPLNAIAGHAQLIELGLHGPVTTAQHDALIRIGRSQQHLLSLVNDVLNLTRIESGRAEYTLEPIEIAPLIDSIVAMIEPLLVGSQLTCRVFDHSRAPAAAPLTVRADREKLQQILLNLLTNAIKFTSARGHIDIDTTCASAAGAACIEVRDSGVGIPAEKLEAIFEPFLQLSTRLSSRQEGIGLGLTISRQFARAMQGDLTVTSGSGEGACFRLTLPLAQPPA